MSLRSVFTAARGAFRLIALSVMASALLAVSPAAAITDVPFGVGVVAPAEGATVSGFVALTGHATQAASDGSFTLTNGDFAPIVLTASASGSMLDWGASWNSASAANGTYTITFTAHRASDGAVATSSPITFNVNNGTGSGTFTVTITAPSASATVLGDVAMSATTSAASDSLSFILSPSDGGSLISVPATAHSGNTLWTATWNSATAANGTYSLIARTFKGGTMTESESRSIVVSNAGGPALAVTIGAPAEGATVSGSTILSASTNVSVTGLGFVVRNGAGAAVATVPATGASGTTWTATWDSTSIGNGSYFLKATASKDGVTADATRAFTVANAAAPPVETPITVGLVAPVNGASLSGTVSLSAHTSATPDAAAFIITQAFGDHQETVVPAAGSGSTWTASWNSLLAVNGSYSVVARAVKSGAETFSPAINVTVANAAPAPAPALTSTVTSPAAGVTLSGTATFVAATNIAANSLAFVVRDPTHPDAPPAATAVASGSAGGTSWTATVDTATIPNGSYVIIARATKEATVVPSSAVSVTVSNAVSAPSSTPVDFVITLPVADAQLSGSVVLSATANQPLDGFGFSVLGSQAGAAPVVIAAVGNSTKTVWNANWDTRTVPNGDYTLSTTALRSGQSTPGAPRHFKVANTTVAVTVVSPAANAEVTGTKEIVIAAVPAATGVSVKITNTTNTTLTTTRVAAFDAARQVWTTSWNTLDLPNGTYRLDAKGTDSQAHEYFASPVTVKVANAATQSTAFASRVVAPSNGATVGGTVGLAAAVTGSAVKVQFFVSPSAGGEILSIDAHFDSSRNLWVGAWNSAGKPNGLYAIAAVAVNASNAKAESDRIQVTAANAAQSGTTATAPPFSVRLLEPADGNVTGNVRFVAQTEGTAAGVRFFVRLKGTTLQRVLTAAPDAAHLNWTAEWDTAAEAIGTYESVAVAKNAAGAETTSAGVVTLFIERIGESAPAPAPVPAPGGTAGETRPTIAILRPLPDAALHGSVGLVAGSPLAAKVRFIVTAADGREVMAHDAVKGDLGWALLWNTTLVPDARYKIEAAAFTAAGERAASAFVGVAVANQLPRTVEAIDIVPTEAIHEAIREMPKGTVALPPEQMPREAVEAGAKLDAECAANHVPPERCQSWLAGKGQAGECRAAGILTKEECISYLKKRHGGQVPECEGQSAEACGEAMARKTAGLLDASKLHEMKETVSPHIGEVLRVAPRVDASIPAGQGAPVPGEHVGKDAPPGMLDLMPFANDRMMAVRVHGSPSYAGDDGGVSHESMPALLFIDTDGDGLPDDLEKRIHTDPANEDTDGDGYTDGTELSKGYNPLGKGRLSDGVRSLAPVDVAIVSGTPIEQPKSSGTETEDLKVDAATMRKEGEAGGMVLKGRGKPGQVVTVFVYSYLPVVFTTTVEDDGTWTYELGSDLTDGEHEVYATVTDETGKIQSKSGALSFFVSEAKAVGADEFYKPEDAAASEAALSPLAAAKVEEPVRRLAGWYVIGGVLLIAVALLISYLLFMRPKRPAPPQK